MEFEVNEDDIDAHWYKDGIEINFQIEERYHYVVERRVHKMIITETRYTDAGEYTFLAGKNRSSITLYVNGETDVYFDIIFFLIPALHVNKLLPLDLFLGYFLLLFN